MFTWCHLVGVKAHAQVLCAALCHQLSEKPGLLLKMPSAQKAQNNLNLSDVSFNTLLQYLYDLVLVRTSQGEEHLMCFT